MALADDVSGWEDNVSGRGGGGDRAVTLTAYVFSFPIGLRLQRFVLKTEPKSIYRVRLDLLSQHRVLQRGYTLALLA